MLNILFMGTPDFAKESLEAIYNAGHKRIGVVTNPDKPKGRGMKLVASPVKEFAVEKNLKVYQPVKIRDNQEFINEINPKFSIISVGKNNRYGHPNKKVLNNLEKSRIYRTDEDGSIMFKIKNNRLKIETCSP